MVLWFARGVRRGVVTTHYPRGTPGSGSADLPTPPMFDPESVTRQIADELVAVCPSGALRRVDSTLVYDVGACTACQRCLATVPGVGRPSGEFELAATVRAQLVKRIPLVGGPT